MSTFTDITALAREVVTTHEGYPPTGAVLPYAVHRPLFADVDADSITGEVIDWDFQYSLYCCGESVEASYNQAVNIMRHLAGARVSGTTLLCSMGYSGAPVEGHYETQVTVQLNQGGI